MDLTSQFVFPDAALADIAERGGLKMRTEHRGVAQYEVGDFDKGIAYEFFIHQEKNQMESEQFDMEINNDVEMIRWIVQPKKLEPCCRVTDLPEQLLKFRKVAVGKNADNILVMKHFRDENGNLECKGGLYKDAYLRWKAGLSAPGLPLSKWDKISSAEVKTLASEGIFSVQQFASISEERIKERFPKIFWERHRDAVHYVNAQNPSVSMADIKKAAEQLVEEKQKNAKLEALLESMSTRLSALEASGTLEKKPSKPRVGGRRKATDETQPAA